MIEVLKQALEALEKERPYLGAIPTLTSKAITSLQQAIAEAEDNYQGSDAAKAAHMMDLYTALGVRWGDNPFAVIAKMRSIAELESQESNPIKDGWKLSVANGHSGYGVYAHMEEYPEEGAFLLLSIKELEKQEPVALTDDEILDAAFSAYCRGENTRELFRIMRSSRLTCSIGWDRDELKAFARNIEALCTRSQQRIEQNFCPRCGKRTNDIHTCTPPQEKNI